MVVETSFVGEVLRWYSPYWCRSYPASLVRRHHLAISASIDTSPPDPNPRRRRAPDASAVDLHRGTGTGSRFQDYHTYIGTYGGTVAAPPLLQMLLSFQLLSCQSTAHDMTCHCVPTGTLETGRRPMLLATSHRLHRTLSDTTMPTAVTGTQVSVGVPHTMALIHPFPCPSGNTSSRSSSA